MRRFKVEVTTTVCHFIDATSEADAIAGALELVSMGARPAYSIEPAANVEIALESQADTAIRRAVEHMGEEKFAGMLQ